MNNHNCNICMSIKSKKILDLRCPNKRKFDSEFCGKHQCNPVLFKEIKLENIPNENLVLEDFNINDEKILNVHELFDIILENKPISVYILRKSLKNSYLKKFINIRLSKSQIIEQLKSQIIKERNYVNNETNIVKIQSIIRMFLKKYRYICANEIDILTMNTKMEIENPYFYRFYNKQNNKYYAYDIRLLNDLIHSNYSSCPYTFRKFEDDEKNIINEYINKLKRMNIIVKEEIILTDEEMIENKAKDLFYKINMLDNYTSHKWFMDLNEIQLMKLYILAEDIWNYRSLLSHEAKYKIIQNNYIFNIPVPFIKKIKSLIRLRHILLDTFNIMISKGIDINEKKLGSMLVLSALVEISPDAAQALPHLIQV